MAARKTMGEKHVLFLGLVETKHHYVTSPKIRSLFGLMECNLGHVAIEGGICMWDKEFLEKVHYNRR